MGKFPNGVIFLSKDGLIDTSELTYYRGDRLFHHRVTDGWKSGEKYISKPEKTALNSCLAIVNTDYAVFQGFIIFHFNRYNKSF
jgi:hypothetical protein